MYSYNVMDGDVYMKKYLDKILLIIFVCITIFFIYALFSLKMIPVKYLAVLSAGLILFILVLALILMNKRIDKINKILTRVICILLAFILGFSSVLVLTGKNTLGNITEEHRTDVISLIVLKDSEIENPKEIKSKIGVLGSEDKINTVLTLEEMNSEYKKEFNSKDYENVTELVKALYDGKVKAILMNETYREAILDQFENFENDTTVIFEHKIEVEIEDLSKNVPVTKEPFSIYISGIDKYGEVGDVSRSDVNIIATINPITKQILLTTTPRDSYVGLACKNQKLDKLTHAGMYGVGCSISTLENVYDTEVNYYVRINFTSLITIIDAIGGVDAKSDLDFVAWVPQLKMNMKYNKGYNHLSGATALAFVRERKTIPGGDLQRAKHQQYVIQAIIDKMISPTFITRFFPIMESVENSFQTNMNEDEIAALVQMQLNDMASWEVFSVGLQGSFDMLPTYSMGSQPLSVLIPYDRSINDISQLIKRVENGERITQEDVDKVNR